jgi:hypothetical protein
MPSWPPVKDLLEKVQLMAPLVVKSWTTTATLARGNKTGKLSRTSGQMYVAETVVLGLPIPKATPRRNGCARLSGSH